MAVFIQRETPSDDAVRNGESQGRRYTIVIEDPCDPVKAAGILAAIDEMYTEILHAGAIERDFSQDATLWAKCAGLGPLYIAHAVANGGAVTEVPRG